MATKSVTQKRLGVIVLTDNREKTQPERNPHYDFRCSAFKGNVSMS